MSKLMGHLIVVDPSERPGRDVVAQALCGKWVRAGRSDRPLTIHMGCIEKVIEAVDVYSGLSPTKVHKPWYERLIERMRSEAFVIQRWRD